MQARLRGHVLGDRRISGRLSQFILNSGALLPDTVFYFCIFKRLWRWLRPLFACPAGRDKSDGTLKEVLPMKKLLCALIALTSVSYTHLDVYKRQRIPLLLREHEDHFQIILGRFMNLHDHSPFHNLYEPGKISPAPAPCRRIDSRRFATQTGFAEPFSSTETCLCFRRACLRNRIMDLYIPHISIF